MGNLKNVLLKAKDTYNDSNVNTFEHFADIGRVFKVGNNADIKI